MKAHLGTRMLEHLFIILIISLFFSCTSNVIENKDESSNIREYYTLKLNGEVKSFEINYYNANDSLINSRSYKFNQRRETVERSSGPWNNHQEFIVYNKNGTRIKRETYVAGKLLERQATIDSLDANGKVIKETTFDINNKLLHIYNNTYYSNGKIASTNFKNFDNGEFAKYQYLYDSNNQLSKYTHFKYDKDSTQIKKFNSEYDSLGNLVLDEYYSRIGLEHREIFTYDKFNNLVEHRDLFSDTRVYWKRVINFNEEGIKLDSICHFYSSSNPKEEPVTIQREEIYLFNRNGNIVKQIFKDEDNKVITIVVSIYTKDNLLKQETETFLDGQTTITEFDKNGSPILIRIYDSKKNLLSEEKNNFEYDSYNNFTKATIRKNNVIRNVIKRKIQYY